MPNPRGFVPSRHINNGQTFRTNLYLKDTQAAIHPGDAVCLVSGAVTTWVTAQVTTFLGVAKAVYDSNKKPRTHALPGVGPCLVSGVAGYVEVYDDPGIVYTVECSTAVSAQLVGTAVDPVHVSGNSGIGVSRQGVLFNAGAAQFAVVGLAPTELAGTPAASNDVEVVARQGIYKPLA